MSQPEPRAVIILMPISLQILDKVSILCGLVLNERLKKLGNKYKNVEILASHIWTITFVQVKVQNVATSTL